MFYVWPTTGLTCQPEGKLKLDDQKQTGRRVVETERDNLGMNSWAKTVDKIRDKWVIVVNTTFNNISVTNVYRGGQFYWWKTDTNGGSASVPYAPSGEVR